MSACKRHVEVKAEPVELEDGLKAKTCCLRCKHKEFAHIRWAVILCMRRCLPGVRDLHRLIAGERYLPFPWIECKRWDWTYFTEFAELYDPDDDGDDDDDDGDNTISLVIDFIDRGVTDFDLFAKTLKQMYPHLRRLQWKQNFSHGVILDEFIGFIVDMKLERLWVQDRQSDMFQHTDDDPVLWERIMAAMPAGAKYTVQIDDDDDDDDDERETDFLFTASTTSLRVLRRKRFS
jgi:hypothetical protein